MLSAMHRRAYIGLTSLLGSLLVLAYLYASSRPQWNLFVPSLRQVLFIVMGISIVDYIWTILWWIAYKPLKPFKDPKALPKISVVMPAYNESCFVRYSLQSILQSSYPKEKLEVIVVDDGSTDDTWEHIARMAATYLDDKVKYLTHRHPKNLGKRFAIKNGFNIASGDIIVSLDSDSALERDTLVALVAPMLYDEKVGGVAGHLSVLNIEEGLIPKMLDVLFDASGNLPRAAQSRACGAVTILPGALSAYRAAAIRPLVDDLCSTTFWGKPIRHGEDVELTLGLLRHGWKTLYQRNAVVHTVAPTTIRKALLTYTRWERSSYVYLFSGFIQLAGTAVFDRIYDLFTPRYKVEEISLTELLEGRDLTIRMKGASIILRECMGRLFLLVNLVSTATGNLFLPCTYYAFVKSASYESRNLPLKIISAFLLSICQGLLFIGDLEYCNEGTAHQVDDLAFIAGGQVVQGEGGEDAMPANEEKIKYLRIPEVKTRLRWRFQFGGLAVMFHASVIVWASMLAILTLRSQKWLTR